MGGNRRTTRRGVALTVALAVHVLLLWIALYIEHRQSPNPAAAAPLVVMTITLPPTVPPPPPSPTPPPRTARPPPSVPQPLVSPEEPRTGAITLPPSTPRIDWYKEAEITVRGLPAPDEGPKERSLDSDVQGMELPNVTRTPRAGDSWIQPDGTIVVLTTVVGDTGVFCKSGPPLLMDHFEIWQRTLPVKCGARSIRKRAPFTLEKRAEDDAQSALP